MERGDQNPRWWENKPDFSCPGADEAAMLEEMVEHLGFEGVVEFHEFYLAHRLEWLRQRGAPRWAREELYAAFKQKWQYVPLTGIERDVMLYVEVLELKPEAIEEVFGVSRDNFYHITGRAEERLQQVLARRA